MAVKEKRGGNNGDRMNPADGLSKNKRLYTDGWQPFLHLLEGYFMK